MYSDGYVDQFGGSENKKFLKDNFYNLLTSFQHLNMDYQSQLIEQRLLRCKGNHDQTDDILVLGVKL
jgi:serine phosphatase RsbU (regulator of sigma subunit)